MRVVSLPSTLTEVGLYVGYEGANGWNVIINDSCGGQKLTVGGDWTEVVLDVTANSQLAQYDGTKTLGLCLGDVRGDGSSKVVGGEDGNVVIQIDYIEYL